jgi:hypothetical protein
MTGFSDLVGGVAVFLFFGAPTFALGWLARSLRDRPDPPPQPLRPRCHTCGIEVGTIYCGTHLPPPPANYRRPAPPQLERRAWPLDHPAIPGRIRPWFEEDQ